MLPSFELGSQALFYQGSFRTVVPSTILSNGCPHKFLSEWNTLDLEFRPLISNRRDRGRRIQMAGHSDSVSPNTALARLPFSLHVQG